MKRLFFAVAASVALAGSAYAEGDLSRANVQRVVMELGSNADGTMFLGPDNYEFETGQAYVWVLTNTDDLIHELAIGEMRERIFTRKIEIADADGNLVAEIKGDIAEVELGPNQTIEWYFVPVQTAEAIDIACELPGHREAGMFGTVTLF